MAGEALGAALDFGLPRVCNAVVGEEDGGETIVVFPGAGVLLRLEDNPGVAEIWF